MAKRGFLQVKMAIIARSGLSSVKSVQDGWLASFELRCQHPLKQKAEVQLEKTWEKDYLCAQQDHQFSGLEILSSGTGRG